MQLQILNSVLYSKLEVNLCKGLHYHEKYIVQISEALEESNTGAVFTTLYFPRGLRVDAES